MTPLVEAIDILAKRIRSPWRSPSDAELETYKALLLEYGRIQSLPDEQALAAVRAENAAIAKRLQALENRLALKGQPSPGERGYRLVP